MLRKRQQRVLDRDIIRLALPALGALAAEPTYLLVDTAVVGHLGTTQLAALGLAATFLASVFWLFNFLANATTTRIANAHGAGETDATGRIAAQAVWLAIGIGTALTLLGLVFAPQIVSALQADDQVAGHATTYLRISSAGAIFVMLALAGQGWARGIQRMDIPLKILVASNALNVVLEVLFVYGFDWGIAGSAWGTVIAQGAAGAAFVWWMRGALARRMKLVASELRPLLSFGGDLFVRTGLMLLCFNVINALLARQGSTPLAANQVLFQLMVFLALVMDSIAISAQSLIGRELGSRHRDQALAYARRATLLSIYAGCALALLLALGHSAIPQAFTSDASVLHEIARVWWLFVIYVLASAPLYGWDGVLLGGSDSRAMMWILVIAAASCLPVAFAMIDNPANAIVAAWIAYSVLNAMRLLGSGIRVASKRWATL